MPNKTALLLQNVIFIILVLCSVATPLFFLPTTAEFFEYNKLTALLVLTTIGYFAWAGRMLLEKKVSITRSPLDIPLLLLLVILWVSSLTSIDQFVSIFGSHNRVWPSFMGVATVVALYFLAVSNIRGKTQSMILILSLVASTTLASAVAIVSYFGLFLPFDFAKIRSFNTLGIINRLALLQTIIIPLSFGLAITDRGKATKTFFIISTLILSLSFVLIGITPLFLSLGAALAFLAFGLFQTKLTKNQLTTLSLITVVITLFLIIRFVPQVARGTLYNWIAIKDAQLSPKEQIDTPKEKTLSAKTGWDVSAQAIGKKPILGTGPSTFAFVYTQLKPQSVNNTDNWSIRFDKSSSEFSEIITTGGIAGTLAYLIFIAASVRFLLTVVRNTNQSAAFLPMSAGILGYLISTFFAVSAISTAAVFFILTAIYTTLSKVADENDVYEVTIELATLKNRLSWLPVAQTTDSKPGKSQILPVLFTILVVAVAYLALNYQVKAYRAEYFFRQSQLAARSNDGNRTVSFLQKAIQANPRVDTYHRSLSQTSLNAALNLSAKKDVTEEDRKILTQLTQLAIDQGKIASGYEISPVRLQGISAANVANWETLSSVYQALIGSVGGADTHAIRSITQALNLDPQNPILHYRLGLLHLRMQNLDLAERKFVDANIVKVDYGPAHYSLAKLLITKDSDPLRIAVELNKAKKYLDPKDGAIADIDKQLEIYNQKVREIQEAKKAPAPTPDPSASPNPKASPSPSTSPSPSAKPTANPSF